MDGGYLLYRHAMEADAGDYNLRTRNKKLYQKIINSPEFQAEKREIKQKIAQKDWGFDKGDFSFLQKNDLELWSTIHGIQWKFIKTETGHRVRLHDDFNFQKEEKEVRGTIGEGLTDVGRFAKFTNFTLFVDFELDYFD